MREYKPGAISIIAGVGGVTFVGLRITWDIVTAQWTHLLYYCLLFIACCIVCIRFSKASDDDNEGSEPPEPSSIST